MQTWMRWIGLPHKFGVHPSSGEGADCVLMVWSILDEAGVYHPPFDENWLTLAKEDKWNELQLLWNSSTRQLSKPQQYAVCLFNNGPAGLGVGVVIDNGVLMVHHKRGVTWVPLITLHRLTYCEFV